MAELQTGWASTDPDHNKYHFYVAGVRLCQYEIAPGELYFDPEQEVADTFRCTACNHPRHKAARRAALVPPARPSTEIANGAPIEVLRGKHAGQFGVVELAADKFPGFWWGKLYDAHGALGMGIMLQEGQLKRREAPA